MLVLGQDSRSFLTVIRSLGRQDLSVHVAWYGQESIPLNSRYIAKSHLIPAYSPGEEDWKQSLLSTIQKEQFDLVIPCDDQTLLPLQAHRKDLEEVVPLALVNDRAFAVVFDKVQTHELAKSLGISLPRTSIISSLSQIDQSPFPFPVVLKPRVSFNLDHLRVKNDVCRVYTPESFTTHLEALLHQGQVLVQENFSGRGVGVEVLAEGGDILVAFQHVRVHEPVTGGGSSYRRSVPVDPELLGATRALLGSLQYTGVAMVEFRMNFETGEWILVEINGRFWGSLPLAVTAGADFPYYLYQLLIEGKREFPQNYKVGIYSRNLLNDFGWMLQNLRVRQIEKDPATLSLWELVKEWINLLTLRERSDTLVLDDLKPGFAEMMRLWSTCQSLAWEKVKNLFFLLKPVRRLHGRKIRRALNKARSVLFVCKGNICRSPFAEAYAKGILGENVQVTSCGYYPVENRVPPAQAVQAAEKLGIDLADHRSTLISEDRVGKAEVILTFDSENQRTVMKRYPMAKGKTHRLGLLTSRGPANIKDPFGKSSTEFDAAYRNIMRLLDSLE